MFDEGTRDDLDKIRSESEGRVRHRLERARQHDTRVLILALLSKAESCLTRGQIRSRLPGPRRPQRSINYHVRVLLNNGLVKQCGDDDSPAFELR